MYTDLQKITSNIAHLHRILCIVNLYHRALTMSSMYFFSIVNSFYFWVVCTWVCKDVTNYFQSFTF